MVDEIPGTVFAGQTPVEPPMVLLQGPEKCGKSTAATTLFDWPFPGARPYVLAFDATGPDSCAQLGYQVAHMKVRDQIGATFFDKARTALTGVETYFARRTKDSKYTSVVVDCASTMSERFLEDAKQRYRHGKKIYGEVLDQSREVMWRLLNLGVPVVWLSWLRESYEEKDEKGRTTGIVMGGPQIAGSFKSILAGKASNILTLEKKYIGVGRDGADQSGHVRVFHTKTWNHIEAGGRFALPDLMPANLGLVLSYNYGMIDNPALQLHQVIQ